MFLIKARKENLKPKKGVWQGRSPRSSSGNQKGEQPRVRRAPASRQSHPAQAPSAELTWHNGSAQKMHLKSTWVGVGVSGISHPRRSSASLKSKCEAHRIGRNTNEERDVEGLGCHVREPASLFCQQCWGALKVWGLRLGLQSSEKEVFQQQDRQRLGGGQAGGRMTIQMWLLS